MKNIPNSLQEWKVIGINRLRKLLRKFTEHDSVAEVVKVALKNPPK